MVASGGPKSTNVSSVFRQSPTKKRPSCCLKHFFEVLSVLGDHLQHRSQGLLETTQLRKFTEKMVKLHGIPGT